jgi:hypothetical protein
MFWKRWFKAEIKTKTKPKLPLPEAKESCVVVKAGVKEVETGLAMGGWQGRVSEVDEDHDIITID